MFSSVLIELCNDNAFPVSSATVKSLLIVAKVLYKWLFLLKILKVGWLTAQPGLKHVTDKELWAFAGHNSVSETCIYYTCTTSPSRQPRAFWV